MIPTPLPIGVVENGGSYKLTTSLWAVLPHYASSSETVCNRDNSYNEVTVTTQVTYVKQLLHLCEAFDSSSHFLVLQRPREPRLPGLELCDNAPEVTVAPFIAARTHQLKTLLGVPRHE